MSGFMEKKDNLTVGAPQLAMPNAYAASAQSIGVGSKVRINGVKYATGQNIPDWVRNGTYTVQQLSGERALIKEITSWVYVKDLTLADGGSPAQAAVTAAPPQAEAPKEVPKEPAPAAPATAATTSISVGSTVSITGSTYATGQNIPNWVKGKNYTVSQINGNRALLKEIVSWVNLADLVIAGGNTASTQLPTPQQSGGTASTEIASATEDEKKQYEAALAKLDMWPGGALAPAEFAGMVGPIAREASRKTRVPASVAIAQAALETGWGKFTIGVAKNLYGIKGTGPAGKTVSSTQEWVNGQFITIQDGFRMYNTWLESIEDYQKLLQGSRYAAAFNYTNDPDKFIAEVHKAGYATDPDYTKKIISIMNGNGIRSWNVSSDAGATQTQTEQPAPAPTQAALLSQAQLTTARSWYAGRYPETFIKDIQKIVNIPQTGTLNDAAYEAIAVWQKSKNLKDIDGLFGVNSAAAAGLSLPVNVSGSNAFSVNGQFKDEPNNLTPTTSNEMTPKQSLVRSGNSVYGARGSSNLTTITFPYVMYYGSSEMRTMRVHKLVADRVVKIFQDTMAAYTPEEIERLGLNRTAGCFNERKVANSDVWSTHSWGIAIDIDAANNPMKSTGREPLASPEAAKFWDIVESHGGRSIGRAKGYDWMHFQFATYD
ncbi:MAG: glucosaminidase domain-containing protein [Proteobacteria bacterium]|nr:glucosaminidase domain-containing protein [Pseudomonadota bacterium]